MTLKEVKIGQIPLDKGKKKGNELKGNGEDNRNQGLLVPVACHLPFLVLAF